MISIILPVYNTEKYLAECIESILQQSYADFELIIVEDCSTDNSKEICQSFKAKDNRISVIYHEKNQGLGESRNHGVELAKGKYIAFIDSDDVIEKDYLEKLYEAAEYYKADVVSCGFNNYEADEQGQYYCSKEFKLTEETAILTDDKKLRMEAMINSRLLPPAWGKLIHHRFFSTYGLNFTDILNEEILFHIPLLYLAERYILIGNTGYYYRKVSNSITNGVSIEKNKKVLLSVIKGLRGVEQYIANMPEISSDQLLAAKIRMFFAEKSMKILFAKISNGLNKDDVLNNAFDVFNKEVPEQAGLLMVLFKTYLDFYSKK